MGFEELILAIIEVGSGIAKKQAAGTVVAKDMDIAAAIAQIVENGKQAYQLHMGEPLDASLIKPEDEI